MNEKLKFYTKLDNGFFRCSFCSFVGSKMQTQNHSLKCHYKPVDFDIKYYGLLE